MVLQPHPQSWDLLIVKEPSLALFSLVLALALPYYNNLDLATSI